MTDMISKFSRSVELIQASAKVLRSDKELLILPLLSGIAAVVVCTTLIWQAFVSGALPALENGEPIRPLSTAFYIWLFAFYFAQYFVIIFFNTALVGAAIARLSGGDPTVSSALALAWSRIVPIVGYALISATIGLLLRMLAERLGFLGRLIVFGAGLAWTVATFLVVPVLAAEGVGPIKAIGRSGELLNETWGENIVGNSGIDVVTSLIGLVIAFVGLAGFMLFDAGSFSTGVAIVALATVAMLMLIIVSTALSGVYSGAVYYYALTGEAPDGFDKGLIRGSFTRKANEA